MLNICFTFDYELFFGKNYGTPQEVLFNPTHDLVECLGDLGVSATFFVDVCSIVQARKYAQLDYIQGFENQLLWMNSKKQDIQLHIHPHWLKSQYNGKEWIFDSSFYRIHSFGFEQQNSINGYSIIKNGRDYLTNLLRKQDKSYDCIAYRAGGFCIQPTKELIGMLYDLGIRIDSSIVPHLVSTSPTNFYDYRDSLYGINWWIGSDTSWNVNAYNSEKKLFEVPIGTYNKNILSFVAKRLFNKNSVKLSLEEMRGSYIDRGEKSRKRIVSIWNYLNSYNSFSMDSYAAEFLYAQIKRFYHKNECENKKSLVDAPSICLIGHPKLVSEKYLHNLKNLISLIKNDSSLNIISMQLIYRYIYPIIK